MSHVGIAQSYQKSSFKRHRLNVRIHKYVTSALIKILVILRRRGGGGLKTDLSFQSEYTHMGQKADIRHSKNQWWYVYLNSPHIWVSLGA